MQANPLSAVEQEPAPAKSFLLSKTFWILVLGVLGMPIAKKLGLEFPDAAQQQVADTIVQLLTGAGALWARSKAQGPLHFGTGAG